MHNMLKKVKLLGLGLFAGISAMVFTNTNVYAYTAADGSEWMVSKASHMGYFDVDYTYYEGTSICKELKYTFDMDTYTFTYDKNGKCTSLHKDTSGNIQNFYDENGYWKKSITDTMEEEFFYEEIGNEIIPKHSIEKKKNGTTIMYEYIYESPAEGGTFRCVAWELMPNKTGKLCVSKRPDMLPISYFMIEKRESVEAENLLKLASVNDAIFEDPNVMFVMSNEKQKYDIQWKDQKAGIISKIEFEKYVVPEGIMQYYVDNFQYMQSGCLKSFTLKSYQKDTDPKSPTYGVEMVMPFPCSYVWVCVKEAPPKVEEPKDDSKNDEKKDDEKKDDASESSQPLKVGDSYTDKSSNIKMKVTAANGKNNEVELIGIARKGVSQFVIPDVIKIKEVSYKVTSIKANAFKNNTSLKKVVIGKSVKKIGKNAFYGCKNLKSVQIKTVKLSSKTVGKNAFAKIHKKAKVKVPSKKYKAYKTLLKSRGINKKSQKISK